MSLVLAPIHSLMYRRILFSDELGNALLAWAKAEGYVNDEDVQALNEAFPEAEHKPLVEIIDSSNIHGWLHDKTVTTEKRLARALRLITDKVDLSADNTAKASMLAAVRELGEGRDVPTPEAAADAFNLISGFLLDGMPCDGVIVRDATEGDSVSWRVDHPDREMFWEEEQLDPTLFYDIRAAFVDGLLADSSVAFRRDAERSFSLTKE